MKKWKNPKRKEFVTCVCAAFVCFMCIMIVCDLRMLPTSTRSRMPPPQAYAGRGTTGPLLASQATQMRAVRVKSVRGWAWSMRFQGWLYQRARATHLGTCRWAAASRLWRGVISTSILVLLVHGSSRSRVRDKSILQNKTPSSMGLPMWRAHQHPSSTYRSPTHKTHKTHKNA